VFSSRTPQAITTSASDERNDLHSTTSEREAIERLRDLLSEIDSVKRAMLKLSDRRRGGDRRQRHGREIDIRRLRVRETHSEILLSKGEGVKDRRPRGRSFLKPANV
jgi:hypothetical protein